MRCFNCLKYGNFAAECKKPRREQKEQKEEANLTQMQDDEPALLLAEEEETGKTTMLINEENVIPKLNSGGDGNSNKSNIWYLDNGASNHMTEQLSKFGELDQSVKGQVRFGDGSTVHIDG